jgi:hypothetical protein
LADYLVIWVDHATDQYLSLPQTRRLAIDDRLRRLARDPTEDATYDPETDRWSTEFDDGGLIVFIASEPHRRVVILRVLDLA